MEKILNRQFIGIIFGLVVCLIVFTVVQNIAGKALELLVSGKDLTDLIKRIMAS